MQARVPDHAARVLGELLWQKRSNGGSVSLELLQSHRLICTQLRQRRLLLAPTFGVCPWLAARDLGR